MNRRHLLQPDSPEHRRQRSEFIRKLVQRRFEQQPVNDRYAQGTPRTIIQFWHDLRQLPADVKDALLSWSRWETNGFTHRLFDEGSAKAFIGRIFRYAPSSSAEAPAGTW